MNLSTLTQKKAAGQKLLVPYVTAGISDKWSDLVICLADAGADAVEIGLPFSDPMIDGKIIQMACKTALDAGYNTQKIFDELRILTEKVDVPLVVMTYYNLILARGLAKTACDLAELGISGSIVPDLTVEELEPWRVESSTNMLDNILLIAPSTPLTRAAEIAEISTGFIYALGLMGITGIRETLMPEAIDNVEKIKSVTDKPVLVGVGISSPNQAKEASKYSDGVVVGSALVKLILDNAGDIELNKKVFNFVRTFKEAIGE